MKPEDFEQAVEEFKVIYREVFGIELSNEDAAAKAQGLLQLFDCLTKGEEKRLQ